MVRTLILIVIILLYNSCDQSTKPVVKKSLREFSWQQDTLDIPDAFQNLMKTIWASSPNDIYLVGHHSGGQIYAGDGAMWHYDGDKWEVVRLRNSLGGFYLFDIDGFSADNVWAVGRRKNFGDDYSTPFFIQFNGSIWNEHIVKGKGEVYSVLVLDDNEIWACGQYGIVYHFNGSVWDHDTLLIENRIFNKITASKIVGDKTEKFILSHWESDSTSEFKTIIYKNKGGVWEILDSTSSSNSNTIFGVTDLHYSKNNELFSVGPYLYKRVSVWEKIQINNQSWIRGIYDESSENIVVVSENEVYHYNGSDWEEIIEIQSDDIIYRAVWLNDNSAFIVGHSNNKTLVWHGH